MPRMWTHPELGEFEVGDRDEAAAVCRKRMKGTTLAKYAREEVPKGNPCPKPVTVNPQTRRDEWILDQIRAWDERRPGPGGWGSPGYHARTAAAARRIGDATVGDLIAAAAEAGECPDRHEWSP